MVKLKVLLAASEVAPFAKTGGLGDVAGSLPIALEELGVDVRVVMPKYGCVKVKGDKAVIGKDVKVYFIENEDYYARKELYGDKFGDYHDNLERFAFFSKGVLERCKKEGFQPDIIHCNDWQTALIPVYLNTLYKYDQFFSKTKVLFTIHNLAYQGLFSRDEYPKIGLDWVLFNIECFEFYGKVNLMKAGLMYADAVTTVSPTHAKEILTREFGCGLEGVLKNKEHVLSGILNGIDYKVWNPETDTKIPREYSVSTLDDKYVNKEMLQKELGLKIDREIPMIGMISRLADQKGLDLLAKIVEELLSLKVQFVLLGTGDNKYHILFEKMANMHSKNTSVNLRFDATLAQKIYAASDLFLIPSRYEPCGLAQMISFRYGTIPVVRETGGLKDSVKEFNPKAGEGNGFTFSEYRADHLFAAIKRALAFYKNKTVWPGLVKSVMALDFSWKRSAAEYLKLYQRISQNNKPM
ncbi:MAG: glycogen/starch synthase [Candidatus Omnitrophica bacterium]|nr:glycogen/starch synthase [Candidatus Omnitrophota bacterium]MDD5436610.1 glycogen/starch synthase [Candidatus Omnitrophota bacterium]